MTGPTILQPPILSALFDGPVRSGPEFKRQFAQYRLAGRLHEAMREVPRTMDLLKWLTMNEDQVVQLYAKECARVVQQELAEWQRSNPE